MKYYHPIKATVSIIFVFVIFGCHSDRSKNKHTSTVKVCDNRIFIEEFEIFNSGAFGGDRVSQYLTDSANFRMYVGTFDNAHEFYSYKCNGDSIVIYKGEHAIKH
jgi:uncharacterized protein YozE (UPF0346 family)